MRRLKYGLLLAAVVLGTYLVLPAQAQNFAWTIVNGVPSVPMFRVGDGSISAPSDSYVNEPNLGWYRRGTNVIGLAGGGSGASTLDILTQTNNEHLNLKATAILGWSPGEPSQNPADVIMGRNAAGQLNITDADSTPDFNINASGAPTPSACGDGAMATGSSNTSGRVDSTNATACTLTFSVTFGGNSADCLIANLTANRGNVSAESATAFTVSNLTAGDDFAYHCFGR